MRLIIAALVAALSATRPSGRRCWTRKKKEAPARRRNRPRTRTTRRRRAAAGPEIRSLAQHALTARTQVPRAAVSSAHFFPIACLGRAARGGGTLLLLVVLRLRLLLFLVATHLTLGHDFLRCATRVCATRVRQGRLRSPAAEYLKHPALADTQGGARPPSAAIITTTISSGRGASATMRHGVEMVERPDIVACGRAARRWRCRLPRPSRSTR